MLERVAVIVPCLRSIVVDGYVLFKLLFRRAESIDALTSGAVGSCEVSLRTALALRVLDSTLKCTYYSAARRMDIET